MIHNRYSLVVLLNVGRHNHLAIFIAKEKDSSDVLLDLMQMFRDKKSIFCLACELLCRLIIAYHPVKVSFFFLILSLHIIVMKWFVIIIGCMQ